MSDATNTQVGSEKQSGLDTADLIFLCVLGIVAAVGTWHFAHQISTQLRSPNTQNVWFESDVSRVYENIISRYSSHHRSSVHPLYSLIVTLAFPVIYKLTRLSADESVNVLLALTSGVFAGLMYLVLRSLRFHRFLSAVLTMAALLSAGGLFFLSVPETYTLSAASILLTLLLLNTGEGTFIQPLTDFLASVASLSITVTNWTTALIGTLFRNPLLRWLQVSINAFFAVTMLWGFQRFLIHSSAYFLVLGQERSYTVRVSVGRIASVLNTLVFNSVVAPAVRTTNDFGVGEIIGPVWKTGLTIQHALPGSGSAWAAVAAIMWSVSLALGLRKIIPLLRTSRVLTAALGFLAFQIFLHIVYGIETFMYSLDWIPLLILISAYGFQSLGRAGYPAAAVFALLLAVNNIPKFEAAAQLVQSYAEKTPVSHALKPSDAITAEGCAPNPG